jgi:site-specific recombinase XerD
MPALDASAPARDAIDEFLRHLAGRDLSASTRRIRKTFLNEYLRHAQQAAGADRQLTARDLLDGERAAAWLADAAEGKTRTRNTLRGPDAAAYPNSMRVRADTLNAFAEFLGEPARVDRQAPARGYHLTPGDTEKLLHDLTVKRPIHANAMTALRTAAVAAVIADTGHGVPEIADLKLSALHLDGDDEARVELDGESFPLTRSTVHILTRWLAARASLIAELEGSDPGYLWIPTKPGRPRGGVPSAKPGISPAAVRTLHASHRALVSQLLGTPLRPGALRAAAAPLSAVPGDAQKLPLLHDHQRVLVLPAEGEHNRHPAIAAHQLGIHIDASARELGLVGGGVG